MLIFPGSNCDVDAYHALADVLEQDVRYIWHRSADLEGVDCVIIPGGFSYGDYLRAGALARFSPVMEAVRGFAAGGGLVLGICNGFQILCEAGLLPGALRRNDDLHFHCEFVHLRVENAGTPFTRLCRPGEVLAVPIAHGEGNYYVDEGILAVMERRGQVVFRYCEPDGRVTAAANPNGSVGNVAGVCNEAGNVLGMMPHPERVVEEIIGGTDGLKILRSILAADAAPVAGSVAGYGVVPSKGGERP